MISEIAKKEFLERKLDSWDWIKQVNKKDLLEQLYELTGGHCFKMKPFLHQVACFLLGTIKPNFLFYLDPGVGKSAIALSLISYFKNKGGIKRKTLILVPYTITIESWTEQVELHSNLTYTPLLGTTQQRWKQLENCNTDLVGLSYPGLNAMVTDIVKLKKKGKRVINKEKLQNFIQYFDAVILDEIHFLKGHSTLSTEICTYITEFCKYKYGLTGTPFGKNLQDLWSQFYLMDFGETLGHNISWYRNIFFKQKPGYWGGFDYVINPVMKPILTQIIKNISIRYEESEVTELPQKVNIIKHLVLGEQAKNIYKNIISEIKDVNWQFKDVENIFIRLSQVCSGFIKLKTEEGEEVELVFNENAKLEALIELLDEIGDDEKLVVFNHFTKTGDIICDRLEKEKIGYTRLYSGTKNKGEGLSKFKKDKDCRVYVINTASGSMSLNLQNARYVVFFEYAPQIIRMQACKRVHRTGQTRRVFEYDFIIKHSIEEKLHKGLQEGKELFNEILNIKDKDTLLDIFN